MELGGKLVVVEVGVAVAMVVQVVLVAVGDGWGCPLKVVNLVCLGGFGLVQVEGTQVICMCVPKWVELCSQRCL